MSLPLLDILVVCRIADSKLRSQIYAKLKNLGMPLLSGVYQCRLSDTEFEHLRQFLDSLEFDHTDCVHLFTLCLHCRHNVLRFGNCQGEQLMDDSWMII